MLCGYEVPGYGGASTAGYDLFRKMTSDGIDAQFVNLIDERDGEFFTAAFGPQLGNPASLIGVHNVTISPARDPQLELQRLIEDVSPDVIVGIGTVATAILRENAPGRRLVFYTSGCSQAEIMILAGYAADAMGLRRLFERSKYAPPIQSRNERNSFRGAELVIANSPMTREFLAHTFAREVGKIYRRVIWSAEWTYESALQYRGSARPFEEREIDLLFAASSWDRAIKNVSMVKKIAARFRHSSIHIAGDVSAPIPRVIHHGLISTRSLMELMGNTRTVVCPSLIDSAPGILYEASAMGCNVVASRNCGNWSLCHPELLADRCHINPFAQCIGRSLTRSYPDNMTQFLVPGSYSDLIETLRVM
jgi:glycosyltransferase involved in cell wall biosynthesis